MKKRILLPLLIGLLCTASLHTCAQLQDLEQLALDIEKLAQFKSILNDMYKGYKILSDGYETIKGLSKGSFDIHKLFLDGLLTVSPTVKQYQRIVDIINTQKLIITQYQAASSHFHSLNILNSTELNYLESVYSNLVDESVKNLDALLMVITDNQLRMSDAERLASIDKINTNMNDQLDFLEDFNNQAALMVSQRQKEMTDNDFLNKIYGF